MIGSKLFIDTAPVIYLVEKNPKFFDQVSYFFVESIKEEKSLVTSILMLSEVAIKPYKTSKSELLTKFERTIKSLFQIYTITWEVADLSAKLRAKYPSLKAVDSLQLATSIIYKFECFITNDRRLKAIREIPVKIIKDL
jgi:predicted nucleic acid-binding protein